MRIRTFNKLLKKGETTVVDRIQDHIQDHIHQFLILFSSKIVFAIFLNT